MSTSLTTLLKGIRWINLLIVLITLYISHYLLSRPINDGMGMPVKMDLLNFILLSLSVLCIMAGGNVINDFFDRDTDVKNAKFNLALIIGKRKTFIAYSILSLSGLLYGLWLSIRIDALHLWSVHLLAVLFLFWYSSHLKSIPLTGNLIVAILCGFIPILPILFEYKSLNDQLNPSYFMLNFLAHIIRY